MGNRHYGLEELSSTRSTIVKDLYKGTTAVKEGLFRLDFTSGQRNQTRDGCLESFLVASFSATEKTKAAAA